MAKMSPDGWAYYASEVAMGGEDYFVGHGEEAGRWVGRAAPVLGLTGEVSPDAMGLLFGQGRDPHTGEPLGRPLSGGEQVAGYALSFSPPKSVSVLWALAEQGVAAEVRAAHDAAVSEALEFLQDHAAFTRRGRAGAVQADSDGFVAAAFVHRTSRAGDPQLHTHVLVANKVRATSDGAWLALDGREIFEVQRAAGLIYKAALRAEVTARLGLGWEPVDSKGGGEIIGVPSALVDGFSARRKQVEAAAEELISQRQTDLARSLTDGERAAIYQLAAYRTRATKTGGPVTTPELRARWRETAVEFAGNPDTWLADLAVTTGPRTAQAPLTAEPVDRQALQVLETSRSTWGRADAVETLSTLLDPAGQPDGPHTRAAIEEAADAVLAGADVVSLVFPDAEHAPAGVLRRRDGMDPTVRHGHARYTTWHTLAVEQAILDIVEQGRTAGVAICPENSLATALESAGLGDDQAAAVRRLCSTGERVGLLVGPAGSGKSRCLDAARSAWQSAGSRVIGVAPSAVAAGVLTEQAGIPADTLARWRAETERSGSSGLQRGDVIICDEASMVATADLIVLARAVEDADAKLVLVGDHRQLGAVEAGGLFKLLVADHDAAELTVIRRFNQAWEAATTQLLRAGDPAAINSYDEHQRILPGERWQVIEAAVAAWFEARGDQDTIVITAADHDTVDAVATRIHDQRVAAGDVAAGGIRLGAQTVSVGDEIVTTHNDRRLITSGGAWVRNGDRWQVQAIRPDGTAGLISLDGRGRVTLPAEYINEHVTLAYAVTAHKAQGVTVDRAAVIVDERTTLEHLYVGMTRGRDSNCAHVVITAGDDHQTGPARSAQEILAAAMRRSSNQPSATEMLRRSLAAPDIDVGRLRGALAETKRAIDAKGGPDRRKEIARLADTVQQHPAAMQSLDEAHQQLRRTSIERERLQDAVAAAKVQPAEVIPRRRWWKMPPPGGAVQVPVSESEIEVADAAVEAAERQVAEAQRRVDHTEQAAVGLAEARASQARRREWLAAHPEVIDYVNRLSGAIRAEAVRQSWPDQRLSRSGRGPEVTARRSAHAGCQDGQTVDTPSL